MDGPWASHFVKFFSEEDHADQFLRGHLHLERLSYFKAVERDAADGRGDPNEAVAMWWQPHDFAMDLAIPKVGATRITSTDLAGPVSMSFAAHEHLHVFCIYALYVDGCTLTDGKLSFPASELENIKRQHLIDERCFLFGRHAVVVPAGLFVNRLKRALRATGKWFKADLVHYYDDTTFHGAIPIAEIPFWKHRRFSFQKEYRVCINSGTEGVDPLGLEIGDLRSCSAKFDALKLNDLIQLRIEPAS